MDYYEGLINQNNKEDKIFTEMYYSIGSVLGAFLGDAMGAYCEFKLGSEKLFDENVVFVQINPVWKTKPGQITDDSEMALGLAYGLMDSINSKPNFNRIAYYYGYWYLGGPFDIGTTTINAMRTVEKEQIYLKIKGYKHSEINTKNYCYFDNIYYDGFVECALKLNKNSNSDGFLMRKTPLAIFCMHFTKNEKISVLSDDHIKNFEEFKRACVEETKLTHSQKNNFIAAIIYSMIITRIIYFKTYFPDYKEVGKNTLDYIKTYIENLGKKELTTDLEEILYLIKNKKPEKIEFSPKQFSKNMCWYMYGLLYSIKVLFEIDGDSNYYKVIKNVINLGGDTDTNAAIVGGVLGAYYGPENLHKKKMEILLKFNPFKSGSRHERPSIYSPGFVLFLANRIFECKRDILNGKKSFSHDDNIDNLPITISTLLKYFAN